jgi:hypothetical protein
MAKIKLVGYTTLIIIGFSFSILIPITLISEDLAKYRNYEDCWSYLYAPSSNQTLDIDADIMSFFRVFFERFMIFFIHGLYISVKDYSILLKISHR